MRETLTNQNRYENSDIYIRIFVTILICYENSYIYIYIYCWFNKRKVNKTLHHTHYNTLHTHRTDGIIKINTKLQKQSYERKQSIHTITHKKMVRLPNKQQPISKKPFLAKIEFILFCTMTHKKLGPPTILTHKCRIGRITHVHPQGTPQRRKKPHKLS